MTTVQHSGNPGELDRDEQGHCDICSQPINGPDLCATDVDLGTCHATCLQGSPIVSLDTGEPMPEGTTPHIYRWDGQPITKPSGTTTDCICMTTGNGSEGCGLCNETGIRSLSPAGCSGCGHIGPVPTDKIACCPGGKRYDPPQQGGA